MRRNMRLEPEMKFAVAAACAAGFLSAAAPAFAKIEARAGIVAHNLKIGSSDTQSNESGANLEVEIVGGRIDRLGWLGGPHPYLMGSFNTQGDTSFGGGGFYWRVPLAGNWTLEPGLGIVVHDGALKNPFSPADPRSDAYAREHQLLGTRTLFRDSIALDRGIGSGRQFGAVAIVSGKISGKTITLTTHVQERYEAFDIVGAYTASIVLAGMALLVLLGMQLYQSGRLHRRGRSGPEEPQGLLLEPVPAGTGSGGRD